MDSNADDADGADMVPKCGKVGGSKVKRDKGGMPGDPGNRRFTPSGNAGRAF